MTHPYKKSLTAISELAVEKPSFPRSDEITSKIWPIILFLCLAGSGCSSSAEPAESDVGPFSSAFLLFEEGTTLDFGDTALGGSIERTFTLAVWGELNATQVSMSITGAAFNFKELAAGGGEYPGQGGTCSETVSEPCTVVLTFSPAQLSQFTAELTLSYFDGFKPQTSLFQLSGRAVNAAALSVVPNFIDYGLVVVGNTSQAMLKITNSGEDTAQNLAFSDLTEPVRLSTESTCGTALLPASSCALFIQYEPLVAEELTQRLTINYITGGTTQTVMVSITGAAKDPATIEISEDSTYDFGEKEVKTYHFKKLIITNQGEFPVTGLELSLPQSPFGIASTTCGRTLVSECEVVVSFFPQEVGGFTGQLEIAFNNGLITAVAGKELRGTAVRGWAWVGKTVEGGLIQKWTAQYNQTTWGREDGAFYGPSGIATDPEGNLYVADTMNHRVQKLDPDGFPQGWIGNGSDGWTTGNASEFPGTGNGSFNRPQGVFIKDSILAVADTLNHRVQRFNLATGQFVDAFGSAGPADGQFDQPIDITIDADDNYYVVDQANNRIQKWHFSNTAGMQYQGFIGSYTVTEGIAEEWEYGHDYFPEQGNSGGTYHWPGGIGLDSAHNLYIADVDNHRIQKLNSNGTFIGWLGNGSGVLNQWHGADIQPVEGGDNGSLYNPSGVKVHNMSGADYIIVADTGNDRIQIFTANGGYHFGFGSNGRGDNQYNYPIDIAVDSFNRIYIADTGNARVQRFNANSWEYEGWIGKMNGGEFTGEWHFGNSATWGNQNGEFAEPTSIAVDSASERFYVVDFGSTRIQIFHFNGAYLDKIAVDIADELYPFYIGLDSANIYVTLYDPVWYSSDDDLYQYIAVVYNKTDWGFQKGYYAWQFSKRDNGVSWPGGVAVDEVNQAIYFADSGNDRIHRSALNIDHLTGWVGSYRQLGIANGWHNGSNSFPEGLNYNGTFDWPSGIAVDASKIYVTDRYNDRIQVFDLSGQYLFQKKDIFFSRVAVDDSGIYTTQMDDFGIQRYSSDLTLLAVYSPNSLYDESLLYPNGISVMADYIYVVDQGSYNLANKNQMPRIQRWFKTHTYWTAAE